MKTALALAIACLSGCAGEYDHGVETDLVGYGCGWLPTEPMWEVRDTIPGKCWLLQPPPTMAMTLPGGERPCGWDESEWAIVPGGTTLQPWLRIGAEPVMMVPLEPVECPGK